MPRGIYNRVKTAIPNGHPTGTQRAAETRLTIELPSGGATIKLMRGKFLAGTLKLSQDGLTFSGPNAKKPSDRQIGYKQLAVLFKSGLLQ